ncbi:flavoprotein [Micromonospora sp. NPDC000089]|uniref:flavoprotein n=1 Tax=unclassified Micromonospora TaxID=2617518 RepID=UPI0036AC01E0
MTDRQVLHLVACAAPPVQRLGELVELLMADGWTVCVIVTPIAATWLDRAALQDQTGYPVRAEWRMPGDPEPHPPADAVLAVPVTFNTVNKWATGVSDTLALGVLNEALGAGLPVHAFPRVKPALAAHPAYGPSVRMLEQAGVVFHGGDFLRAGEEMAADRWAVVVDALRRARPVSG